MKLLLRKCVFPISLLLTVYLNGEVFDGHTLFTPLVLADENSTTYLINNNYEILHTWSQDYGPASMPYLLQDGSIIYPFRVPFPTMEAGGVGGGVQRISWDLPISSFITSVPAAIP